MAQNATTDKAGVDRLIQGLGPLSRRSPGDASTMFASFGGAPRRPARLRPIRPPMTTGIAWMCILLFVALGAALPWWPYERANGWGLLFYMCSVALLLVGGAFGLMISWNARLGYAHLLALCTFLWGLALTAEVVLPRVGYAKVAMTWWYQ